MSAEIIPLFSIATLARSPRLKSEADGAMELLADASHYLDSQGRNDVQSLTGETRLLYAQASVRLTFLISHLASWAFVQRSAIEGAMSHAEAGANSRACLATLPKQAIADDACLSDPIRALIRRAQTCQAALTQLHAPMYPPDVAVA